MKWISSKYTLAAVLPMIAINAFAVPNVKTIYGLASAQHLQNKTGASFYIQLGSFSNRSNALKLEKATRIKTKFPVTTHRKNGNYVVSIGPINSVINVRAVGQALSSTPKAPAFAKTSRPIVTRPSAEKAMSYQTEPKERSQYHTPTINVEKEPSPIVSQSLSQMQSNWFASFGVGGQFSDLPSGMTVNNGSGFPTPYDKDIYSTNDNGQVFLGASLGRRWNRDSLWLPAFSLGGVYQYFFKNNAGGTVMQYSTPEFKNYDYQWNVSSNVILATAKLNLVQYNRLSPYVQGGIGAAFNRASGYSETALPGVTARVSPGFTDNTSSQFAYNAGAGVDLQLAPQFIFSIGYLYQDLGDVSSGAGMQDWAGKSLHLSSSHSNDVFVSMNYLFNK